MLGHNERAEMQTITWLIVSIDDGSGERRVCERDIPDAMTAQRTLRNMSRHPFRSYHVISNLRAAQLGYI